MVNRKIIRGAAAFAAKEENMDFLSTFINVLIIVVLAVPGFFLRRAKLFPDKAASVLATLLLYIAQPFLMMASLLGKQFRPEMLPGFGWVILFAVSLQLLVYFIARLAFSRDKDKAAARAAVASSYLGNVGFMGIPVMQMLFPGNDELVLYTVIYNIAFNAMAWTLGVYAVTGEKRHVSPLKILINPPTIAVIAALPFFFCSLPIPEQVMTPIQYLGDMTLPLSMIILGVRLADMPIRALVCNVRVYAVSAIKLIVSPLAGLGVMLLLRLVFPIESSVIIALFIIGAMPTASSALNFAEMYGGDCETAAASTLMSTVLCIATIPVLMLLCNYI